MRVLLTGATGFVGRHLYPALLAAGCRVRCATRNVGQARRAHPDREWVHFDVERPDIVRAALEGCDAAFYLIHGMGQGADYPEREARSADNFVRAAEASGVRRIVYLGGVAPSGARASKHLASRHRTGELLRAGAVSVIELRAAMIIGAGSASWTMVRDLAARLPAMVLPSWLRNPLAPRRHRRRGVGAPGRPVPPRVELADLRGARPRANLAPRCPTPSRSPFGPHPADGQRPGAHAQAVELLDRPGDASGSRPGQGACRRGPLRSRSPRGNPLAPSIKRSGERSGRRSDADRVPGTLRPATPTHDHRVGSAARARGRAMGITAIARGDSRALGWSAVGSRRPDPGTRYWTIVARPAIASMSRAANCRILSVQPVFELCGKLSR